MDWVVALGVISLVQNEEKVKIIKHLTCCINPKKKYNNMMSGNCFSKIPDYPVYYEFQSWILKNLACPPPLSKFRYLNI